jgi:hypothetical protein
MSKNSCFSFIPNYNTARKAKRQVMLDTSLIVQSAAATFNNAALYGPEFFWSAVLALPIFAVFWIFADKLSEYKKYIPTGIIAVLGLWLLTHGSYEALRNESSVAIIVAMCLFAISAFAARRLYDIKLNKFARPAIIAGIIVAAGLLGAPGIWGFALQAGAVASGLCIGYILQKKNYREYPAEFVGFLLMAFVLAGIAMQPEFFRFGQLGRLTAMHILGLGAAGMIFAAHIVFKFIKPAGFLNKNMYKKAKILSRMLVFLGFALFAITESAMAFGIFIALFSAALWLSVRHAPKRADFSDIAADAWILSLGAFGLVANIPLFICAAIVLWRARPHDFDVIIRYIK